MCQGLGRFSFLFVIFVSAFVAVIATFSMTDAPNSALDNFCGKYYFNDDRRYNFVAAEKFESQEEKSEMIILFKPSVPKAREDMPALKIMMLKPGARNEDDLFVHDTLYNIQVKDVGSQLLMECWTG